MEQVRVQNLKQLNSHECNKCHAEVRKRSGRRDDQVVPPGVPQVQRVDGDGFGPAERRCAHDNEDHREQDRSYGIDVSDGIQRDSSHCIGRRISHFIGRPSVRGFMYCDGKKHHE